MCLNLRSTFQPNTSHVYLSVFPFFLLLPVIHMFTGLTWSWRCQSSWSWSCPSGARGPWLPESQASLQTEPFSSSLVWGWQWWQRDERISCHPSSSFYSPCLPFAPVTPTQDRTSYDLGWFDKHLGRGREKQRLNFYLHQHDTIRKRARYLQSNEVRMQMNQYAYI